MPKPTIESLQIEEKLQALRVKWKSGKGDREIIKRQARALEIARDKILKRTSPQAKLPLE